MLHFINGKSKLGQSPGKIRKSALFELWKTCVKKKMRRLIDCDGLPFQLNEPLSLAS